MDYKLTEKLNDLKLGQEDLRERLIALMELTGLINKPFWTMNDIAIAVSLSPRSAARIMAHENAPKPRTIPNTKTERWVPAEVIEFMKDYKDKECQNESSI